MLLYHGFAAAALTDAALRSADAFRNERNLRAFIGDQLTLARQAGQLADGIAPDVEARAILALLLGLSPSVLLEGTSASHAEGVLDAHLARLGRQAPGSTSAGPG